MFKWVGHQLLKSTCPHLIKNVIRNKRNAVRRKLAVDPGVHYRSQLLLENSDQLDFNDEDFDDVETDFMGAGHTHREHLQQIRRLKEKETLLIVKQKYFKERFPNFLTWSDKKQIQHLHKTNPDEWTIEKLSESFPALPETIKKIVDTTWTKTPSKIINHDNSVKKNWTMFKTGELKLPPDLADHLQKFTDRAHSNQNQNVLHDTKVVKSVPKIKGEFTEIIESYERLKNKSVPVEKEEKQMKEFEVNKLKKETYLSGSLSSRKNTTLKELVTSIETKADLGLDLEEDDKILMKHLTENKAVEDSIQKSFIIDLKEVSKTAYLSTNYQTEKDNNHLKYPEKIKIPKDQMKRGCTYKLYDCYYDSDGWFLYRVPGMEK